MKFKKYNEEGGFIYTPFLFNIGAEASQPTTTTSGSSKKTTNKDDGFDFDKALLDAIKTNGIPSDYEVFIREVSKMMTNLQYQELLTGQESSPIAQLSAIYGLANRVKENKASYDTAVQTLQNNQAWSEVATSTNGDMYVLTSKGVSTVSPTEYHNNSDQYQALTNGQLMELRRRQGTGLEFQDGLLIDMSNATSMKQVNDYLRAIIKDFGSTKMSGYTSKQHSAIQSGLNLLTSDIQYKYNSEYQVENSEKDIKAALTYLYDALPQNMKNLIIAKTAAENGDPTSNDVYSILEHALRRHIKTTYTVDYDEGLTKATNAKPDGLTGSAQHTRLTQAVTGHDLKEIKFNIKPFQSDTMFEVKGNDLGRFWDFNEKTLPQSNLKTLFTTSELGTSVDSNSISFGDQMIDFIDSNGILWDGNNVKRVVLPYTIDALGRKTPNFSAIAKANQIVKYLKDHTSYTTTYLNQLVNDTFNGEAYYDAKENSIKFKNEWVFLSFSAYAGYDTIPFDENSQFIKKLSRPEGRRIKDLYNNMTKWGVSLEGKEDKASPIGGQGDSEANDIYQANVFIPFVDQNIGYFVNNHSYVSKQDFTDLEQKASNGKMRTNF